MEIGHHGGDTAGGPIVPHDEPRRSALDHLQFADVVGCVGVPDDAPIFHDWSN